MARKTLSILLALCMVLSLMPFGAFAAKNDTVTYELTDQLVEGVEYLIVSADEGEAVALTNNGGSQGTTPVTIVDGKIQLDDASAVWTSEVSNGKLNLGNSGKWLKGASGGLSFVDSIVTDRAWDYTDNQLRSYSRYKLYYDAANNKFATNSSTTEKVYLFAKEGSIVPPATLEPGTYMIVIDGHALTANRSDAKLEYPASYNSSASEYTGLNAADYTEGMVFSSSMVWSVSAVEGGFAISNGDNRLAGSYVTGTNLRQGDLNVGSVEDVWTFSNGKLASANAGRQLAYELEQNMFTVRSTGGDVTFVSVDPNDACKHNDVDFVGAVDATCTEDGYTGDLACTACGEVFEAGAVIPALGHDWGEWVVTTPAGDLTPGEKTRTCARCGATETQEIEPLNAPTYVQADRLVNGVEYLIVNTNEEGTAYVMTNPGVASGSASMGKAEVLIVDGKITAFVPEALWTATTNGEGFTLTNDGNYLEGKSNAVSVYAQQQNADRFWTYSSENVLKFNGSYTLYYSTGSNAFKGSSNSHQNDTVYLFALEGAILPCQHENLTEHAAKAANCTEAGNDAYWECEDCHKLFSDAGAQNVIEEPVVYEALGHNWGEWTLVTAAGATTPGSEKRVCSRCGEEETRATDPTGVLEPGNYVIVIDGNAITSNRSASTAPGGSAGYEYTGLEGVPYVDGETEATAAMIWTVEAVDGGYIIRSGENYLRGTYSGTVGDLAVSEQSDVWTIDSTRLKSTNASKHLGYIANYNLFSMRTYRPESTDANLKMDVVFYPVEAFVCDHASTETRGAVEATCTEPGYTGDVYCTVCGEKIADGEAIPALGHDYEAVVTAPTCTEQGYTTHTCTRCEDAYVDSYVDALGHAWDDGVVTQPATCTEDGIMTFTCTRDASHTRTEVIAAAGHDYEAVVTAPTCTEQGFTTYTCKNCGDTYVAEYVDALGHDYEAVVTAPTCTDAGFTTYTCERCGDSYVGDQVDALGHDFGAWTVTKAATCTEAGTETRTCSRCDEAETRPVDALGHDYEAVVTAPTCTDQGYTTYTCSRCGDSYKDNYVDALGHSWDEGIVTKEATTTEEGVMTYTCTRCDETRTEAIPMVVPVRPNPFKDVAETSYYYDAVLWAFYSEPQITTGVTETTFAPNNICTRAHVVAFLWRANGCPEPVTTENPFTDVHPSTYYYKAVLWAYENGITTGTTDTTFNPDGKCTRAHVVTFLWRAQGSPEPVTETNPFEDVSEGAYFYKAVLWAAENGITTGKTDTTFEPYSACTRANAVTFLYRALATEKP